MSGIDATVAIRAEFPDAHIIMLTTFELDTEIQRALAARVRANNSEKHAACSTSWTLRFGPTTKTTDNAEDKEVPDS